MATQKSRHCRCWIPHLQDCPLDKAISRAFTSLALRPSWRNASGLSPA